MRARRSIMGAVWFFVTIAAVVTLAVVGYSCVARFTDNNTLIAVIMLGGILALALVCTVIDVARRRVTVDRPVRKILGATDRIAAGDFSVRLEPVHPYGRYDEYDRIMENLNKMAAELSKTAVLNNDFVSNVSHELKTPLAVVQNYAAALKKDGVTDEERKHYADVLEDTAKKLTALVGNVLKLNRLENHEITPEFTKIDLEESLARAVLKYEDMIENKNLRLECDLQSAEVYSVEEYLDIIWNNLISNAVKFTDSGGAIKVSLRLIGGKAVVSVADTGCGIDSGTGARIFEKFYQGDTSHAGEGNGLGLALVKKVIDVLGGEIHVESARGKGSVFTVSLPAVNR
mgnify:FL=1